MRCRRFPRRERPPSAGRLTAAGDASAGFSQRFGIEFNIRRDEIARYGLTVMDVQDVLEVALGGMPLSITIEGLDRFSITLFVKIL